MSNRPWEWIKRHGKRLAQGFGILLAILFLTALGGLVYLNRIGLPDLIKSPILAELRARGLDVHFHRLRWHWYRGLVAEDLNLGRANRPFGTQLYIDEAELRLDRQALRHLRFVPQALLARGGRLSWQFPSPTNPTPTRLVLDDITADLSFLPGDRWEIRTLQGVFEGAPIQLTGVLTNASHLRRLRVTRDPSRPPRPPSRLFDRLETILRQIQFRRPPVINLVINADAKSPHPYRLRFFSETSHAQSKWGNLRNFILTVHLAGSALTNATTQITWDLKASDLTTPSANLSEGHAYGTFAISSSGPYLEQGDFHLEARQVQTAWGGADQIQLSLDSTRLQETNRLITEVRLVAENLRSQWGNSAHGRFETRLHHSLPLALLGPTASHARLELSDLNGSWGSLRQLSLTADANLHLASTATSSITLVKNMDWLDGADFSWQLKTEDLRSPKLVLPSLTLAGTWKSPRLEVNQLVASLYGGDLTLQAGLDASTRRLQAETRFDFNVHDLSPLLNTNSQRWLRQFGWQTPPQVSARGSLLLPVLDGAPINWRRDVLPTVHLQGYLQATNCSYRRVEASGAQTHFILSNGVWNLPDLRATRPEGDLDLEYTSEILTQDYHWVVRSRISPQALRPLFKEGGNKALDLFDFTEPPSIEGHVWGRWQALPLLGAQATLVATNLAFRDAPWKGVTSQIFFTNGVLRAEQAKVWHLSGTADLPLVRFDIPERLIAFSNGVAHLDPNAVTHAIGPQTEEAISYYKFKQPPTVRVNGYLSVPKPTNVNMHFIVQGGPFEYWKFHLPLVNGELYWRGDNLLLTNLNATFYRGMVRGGLSADFAPRKGTALRFHALVSNAELHDLMADVATRTNSLEGNLSGILEVDYADTSDWKSWQGKGSARVEKGVLWDIPLFGILSPVLNTIHPGLGRSRFDQGTATYTIENSVIHTKDLQIRSPTLRLYYTGSVDFDGRVNALAEASLLRDTPLLGPVLGLILSPLTKLFVYRVTGTLGEPKKEPLYIPKPLQILLSPVKTIRDLLPDSNHKKSPSSSTPPSSSIPPSSFSTNSPPSESN